MSHSATRTAEPTHQRIGSKTPEAAVRLLSETAHDLVSSITTIRESVRLVREGDLGMINEEQALCLSAAMDQCDCMNQMVGEMVQLERLRTGVPRVHRKWYPAMNVRAAVDETLRPWALPRNITVIWDGADNPNLSVFVDPSMLRRLIVNLVANSIRATADGECVLVRLQPIRGGDAIEWSIVDQGSGISEANLQRIAAKQNTSEESEGLGMTICRQLAALHFSTLKIRSRGTGYRVEVGYRVGAWYRAGIG